ncbi:unnamed protein product [Zymoseptoria tritici ST99CH_3D7]|uniref:C2H2-type domain-containing protein n=1 Tax=Zymoseptoria tritici (strain ST99CH_3D7) TaxID=1276538 RepID=A0A1X7RKP6_ZYMT9|nr:unnamed protein product [Zymoseptoria tritici ST99CH_3D7]
MVETFLKQGLVTQDRSRIRRWAGVFVLRQLVTAMFKNACNSGAPDWSVVIYRCLSITLSSALGCRPGDITTAWLQDHDLNYLAYMDITATMKKGGKPIDDLSATVVIRNEKGHKFNSHKNRTVPLNALPAEDCTICPIKLLLIHALRTGQVEETSIDELITNLARRPSRQVIWKNPKHPVLCAIGARSIGLDLEEPAIHTRMAGTLEQASVAAGLLAVLKSYDLRRGAARDLANNPDVITGTANAGVGAGLGHLTTSVNVTAHYIGDYNFDHYSARVANPYQDQTESIPVAIEPFQEAQHTKAEVTAACEPAVQMNRNQAFSGLRKRKREDWRAEQTNKRHLPSGSVSNIDTASSDSATSASSVASATPAPLATTDETEFILDPALREPADTADRMLFRQELSEERAFDLEDLAHDYAVGQDSSSSASLPAWMTPDDNLEFVRRASTINVSSHTAHGAALQHAFRLLIGGSRNAPSEWIHPCNNHIYGCTYTTTRKEFLQIHEESCKMVSHEAAYEIAELEAKNTVPCVHQCGRMFSKQEQYGQTQGFLPKCSMAAAVSQGGVRHGKITGANLQSLIVRRQPDGTAKAPPPPLTQQKSNPFEDKTTKYNPSPCLVDGCTAKGGGYRFRNWESYKRHLL